MHQVVHALPALLVVWCVVTLIAILVRPGFGVWLLAPVAAYCCLLLTASIQGALQTQRLGALLLIPVLAPAMHYAYGIGYLQALAGRHPPSSGGTRDWRRLERVPAERFHSCSQETAVPRPTTPEYNVF
jgi:hypothetical protein